jgi:sugar/nucleoside kinase (ribokinase family)
MPSIAIIGELNLDFIVTGAPALPQLGEEVIVGDMTLTLGSSSAILACQLAKLGDDVVFVSKAGSDDFGRRALAFLTEKGVPAESVQVIPSMSSGLTISIAVGSERAMLTQLGTIEEMRAQDVDWERLRGCRHLHISSYSLQSNLRPDVGRIFAEAHRRGMTSLDTAGPRPTSTTTCSTCGRTWMCSCPTRRKRCSSRAARTWRRRWRRSVRASSR